MPTISNLTNPEGAVRDGAENGPIFGVRPVIEIEDNCNANKTSFGNIPISINYNGYNIWT